MKKRQQPSPSSDEAAFLQQKAHEINLVLLEPTVDLWKLRRLALTEGGLVNGASKERQQG